MSILYRREASVTWERLVVLEPRLAKAKSIQEIGRLVGWTANRLHPTLRSSDAYHIALDRLLAGDNQPAHQRLVSAPEAEWNATSCMEACK